MLAETKEIYNWGVIHVPFSFIFILILLFSSQRAIVTLWGDYAESFDAISIQRASTDQPMVALFVGMTVGQFSG